MRLTANRAFWGVAAVDSNNNNADWGYSWLANRFLTEHLHLLGHARRPRPADHGGHRSAQRITLSGDANCTIPPTGSTRATARTASRSGSRPPQDNTHVRIDFNNDGLYDLVDLTATTVPTRARPRRVLRAHSRRLRATAPWGRRANCIYTVHASAAPRFSTPTTRPTTTTPAPRSSPTGRWPWPTARTPHRRCPWARETVHRRHRVRHLPASIQRFLDPVLVLDKSADRTTVPTDLPVGTTATRSMYTLTLRSFDIAHDLTSASRTCCPRWSGDAPAPTYVTGSTLITLPDLSQIRERRPTPAPPTVGGRTRLTLEPSGCRLATDTDHDPVLGRHP